jgi:hypothetical protein
LITTNSALSGARCTAPGKGNDKGKVEALVKYSRANFLTNVPHAASFGALNAALEERCPGKLAPCLPADRLTVTEGVSRDEKWGGLAHVARFRYDLQICSDMGKS